MSLIDFLRFYFPEGSMNGVKLYDYQIELLNRLNS